ncbi:MAG: hypothetical protein V4792_19410 [Pseudomonadota bacterium]
MTDSEWAIAFVRELLRLGTRADPDDLLSMGLLLFASEGKSDPVTVARREFIESPPHGD